MSQAALFTRYIGVIVILAALLLTSPRWTAYGWLAATRWLSRAGDTVARAVRPHAGVQVAGIIPVLVRVGGQALEERLSSLDRHLHGDLSQDGGRLDGLRDRTGARIEVLDLRPGAWPTLEVPGVGVEARAVLLGATGLVMITQPGLVDAVPMPIATTADLVLVLATFLVLKAVVEEHLSGAPVQEDVWAPPGWELETAVADPVERDLQRTRLLRTGAGILAFTWPGVLGTALAQVRFGHGPATLAVGGAFELAWVGVAAGYLAQARCAELRRSLLDWLDGAA